MTEVLETIPPGWITKREALRELNRGRVTFERLAKENNLEARLLRRPNAQPELLYSRAAVRSLKGQPRRLPAPSPSPAPTDGTSKAPSLVQRLLAAAAAAPAVVAIDRKHLLTMKEAHALGYPYEVLRRLRELPEPPGVRYGKRSFRFIASELSESIRRLDKST
jgi:hypothetical protein